MKTVLLVLYLVTVESAKVYRKYPFTNFTPCLNSFLVALYQYGSHPLGEENQYILSFNTPFEAGTTIIMEFDGPAFVEVSTESLPFPELSKSEQENTFQLTYHQQNSATFLYVNGAAYGKVPYFNSVKVNGVEQCTSPLVGYLDTIVEDLRLAKQVTSSLPVLDCGKRILNFTGSIDNAVTSSPGEWPWHTAIYRLERASKSYICGGTLISKRFVLTAAHCATINKVPVTPDILRVVLGKYHYTEEDTFSEEREVSSVIVHDNFESSHNLDDDIAILRLKTEADFNDYVQPACLWFADSFKSRTYPLIGTVVGWGYNQANDTASELKHTSLPMVSKFDCVRQDPIFYRSMLKNNKKFCAGWGNGTIPCNGDSGSGFLAYSQYTSDENLSVLGGWYLHGIVSNIKTTKRNECDPNQYIVFTDISKYEIWIRTKIYENVLSSS